MIKRDELFEFMLISPFLHLGVMLVIIGLVGLVSFTKHYALVTATVALMSGVVLIVIKLVWVFFNYKEILKMAKDEENNSSKKH